MWQPTLLIPSGSAIRTMEMATIGLLAQARPSIQTWCGGEGCEGMKTRWRKVGANRNHQAGFSLIETMLVCAIMWHRGRLCHSEHDYQLSPT